ncbi:MAG TPA: hypothetical protein VFE88_02075 [Candidatus Nanoarchaeia archaeon]|nr:hypothetical protein [Candidatus Nanoarchaeia archaeon]
MKVKVLEIAEIRAVNVNSKKRTALLKVSFVGDAPLTKEVSLDEEYAALTMKLLKWIKEQKREADDDDHPVLGGISLVNIRNDEEVLEVAPKGFFRLDQKLDGVKGVRNAHEYMKAYGQLLTMQEVIFRKKENSYVNL